jgi:hypothetical protein
LEKELSYRKLLLLANGEFDLTTVLATFVRERLLVEEAGDVGVEMVETGTFLDGGLEGRWRVRL